MVIPRQRLQGTGHSPMIRLGNGREHQLVEGVARQAMAKLQVCKHDAQLQLFGTRRQLCGAATQVVTRGDW
ncbi:hypothetical protein [Enhygromyxa salina]|uniref:hypothetical protein n=1 Tax=Enhygromyxa salina TaxID=215803 RepID=UPI0011B203F1|nr:hypothetical protein [Enhygromyxa salina]